MLRKLMKYEILSTGRLFLICYAGLLIMSAVMRLFLPIRSDGTAAELVAIISVILYSALIIAVIALTFVASVNRFSKSLLGGEGYLMHTLPVGAWKHILCKLIVAIFWCICSFLVVMLSVLLLATAGENIVLFLKQFVLALQDAAARYSAETGHSLYFLIFSFCLTFLVSGASLITEIYASIMIGQLFNRHRTLAAVVAFIVIQTALSTLFYAVYLLSPTEPYLWIFMADTTRELTNSLLWVSIAEDAGLAVVFFFVTYYLMRRRLNLE
jgi:hypothetical protein